MKTKLVLLFFMIALVISMISLSPVNATPDKDQECSKCHEERIPTNRKDNGKHKGWDKHDMDKSRSPKVNRTDQEPEPEPNPEPIPIPQPQSSSQSEEGYIIWEIFGIKILIPLETAFGLTILFCAVITGLACLGIWKMGRLPDEK